MARIRSTKPEFWRSKTICALDWDVRLVLKALESYVDDNGVGKDDLALIAADMFPRDLSSNPRDTLARLSEAISLLAEHQLVARYEVRGEELLYIDKWRDLQRIDKPGRGRFERPDGTIEYSEVVNRDSYRSPREGVASPPEEVAPGTGEQGNRGTGEQGNSDDAGASSTALARLDDRDDVEHLCNLLADRITDDGSKRPAITKAWRDSCRLMIDKDHRDPTEIAAAIIWCQQHHFWRTNILSMPKLREKYDQLRKVAASEKQKPLSKQAETDAMFERAAVRMGVVK